MEFYVFVLEAKGHSHEVPVWQSTNNDYIVSFISKPFRIHQVAEAYLAVVIQTTRLPSADTCKRSKLPAIA